MILILLNQTFNQHNQNNTIVSHSCCGAGTAADTEKTNSLIASQLELHRLHSGRPLRVVTAETMIKQMLFRYQVD